ncbi:ABC transporter ATP-binding protein [Microbispora rosea subsp. aerata]|nr:ABC transporter ATP-binding protein [Microbispora rosea]GGO20572.1 ABC transporter ATP-binding protein [Microbispora rosea subsp. aerata]GIH57128.1 ABC transporter ATP-binding protein [Microbispora rosea subsp. aerata]GLJ84802.1 ABC transporter ATP-binding protein [Microbispora rosea subsp. aerata]
MFEIRDLHVSYGKVTAVRGMTLSAEPGKVTLVLGANGAGKTTTLRSAAGLHKPDSGSVVLDGETITGLPAHKIVKRGLVLVPEGRHVFAPLTVMENLRMGGYTTARGETGAILDRVFEMFPVLKERQDGAAGLLSGGEQQMLAFGRALMAKPKIMMLDEPSMGLAPTMVDTVLSSIRAMADSGIGVLMVEQNAEAGLEVADDVAVVARGEVVFSGTAKEARSNSSVLRAFLGEAALVSES